ncbi:MAG TPA: formylglycine-generating enzyme family protein [Verrucomicrobiota bacterium]|nr:formylglycine-generating enzyme family protein [Verrucomicrobiota bacterium]
MNMVFIPPGTFRMGSPMNEVDRVAYEGPQKTVRISRGFWMGKYEVTQGEYLALIGNNPSRFQTLKMPAHTNWPVEQVTWFDATNYCGVLTQRERVAGRIPTNSVYRLPTGAEWEYACRAGTTTRFSYGDDPRYRKLARYAWYGEVPWYRFLAARVRHGDSSGATTHPVGQKLPNPWGLYDMYGNVWEWCQDWWADRLSGQAGLGLLGSWSPSEDWVPDRGSGEVTVDPQGPDSGVDRVVRGGNLELLPFGVPLQH